MRERLVGTPLHRREDRPLLTGRARYTDDVSVPGMAHAAILRSRFGHAIVDSIDVSGAEMVDGVVAAFTGEDVRASDAPGVISRTITRPGGIETRQPVLATDRVRYVGEALAVVVAEDRYAAHEATDRVEVEYDRLDALVDARAALEADAPVVHERAPDNVAFDWEFGNSDAVDAAIEGAHHVSSVDLRNQRLVADPMEPRSVLAEPREDGLTVTMTTQTPYQDRDHFASALGIDAAEVRVIAPAVGGGFGMKGMDFPDEIIVAWAATQLDRPVKWTSTRAEGHVTDYQSRDWYLAGELAVDEDARMTGLRLEALHSVGAYNAFPSTIARNVEILLSGQYRIPAIHGHLVGSYATITPTAPYRGAGRPEVIYFVERLVDTAARDLGMDPAAFRRLNQIPADAFPYETPTGSVYDSGDYESALEMALAEVDYATLRERQATLRQSGRYLGVGISCFVENSGSSPGMGETGRVAVHEDGRVTATLGTHDHGQGHGTTFSQLLADELGVDYDDVEVVEGDTADLPDGTGTFGSRSAALGGAAVVDAAGEVRDRAREVAADRLEAALDDLEFADAAFHVRGAPDRSVSIADVAADLGGAGETLEATAHYDPPNYGYTFGTHVAVVEVDPDTGEVAFERYVAVDDCGTVINPLIVEGQIHGGVAQGIGQALYEDAVYDEGGTLLAGSLQDYALPKADHVPDIETHETVTPSPHNPLGVKGTGESGTIAATPAVANAVVDALEPFGVDDVPLPITPEKLWRAMRADG